MMPRTARRATPLPFPCSKGYSTDGTVLRAGIGRERERPDRDPGKGYFSAAPEWEDRSDGLRRTRPVPHRADAMSSGRHRALSPIACARMTRSAVYTEPSLHPLCRGPVRRRLIPAALRTDLCPLPGGDGRDDFGLLCEAVPRDAAGIDDGVVVVEDADGEPVGSQVLPDILDPGPAPDCSNCLSSSEGLVVLASRNIALRMVRSFLAQAVMATLVGFPASWRRLRNARRAGSHRLAMKAAR